MQRSVFSKGFNDFIKSNQVNMYNLRQPILVNKICDF